MTNEKWQLIKGMIKEKFEIIAEGVEELEDAGPDAKVEIIEFFGPLGKMRLERTDQPLVEDKKVLGSRRIGSKSAIEYKYSKTERVNKFKAFKRDENDEEWVEMEMEKEEFSL